MAHTNETSPAATNGLAAGEGGLETRVVSAKTRNAFHDLLGSATVLSGDQSISVFLDDVERIPYLEDKIKQNEKLLRTHENTRQQALHDYNSDRDLWVLEKQQLKDSALLLQNELASINEQTRSLKNEKASWASEVQTLKENTAKQNSALDNRQKQIQGLVKAIETERQDNLALKRTLASSEARTKEFEREHSELQKNYVKARNEADIAMQQLQEAAKLSVPLRDDLLL
ncbi:hypothetical protein LTR62_000903 [Meristemomyces frigidus]|uniref:Uncharacterized protein n=1 Tax=Meristemomyces frigidus TaxID=1508187 RepID=A0AAN7T9R2_9PEZI|nr:hypothetical protein LTR62_000903 [Meristemomyces frigidus]